MDLVTLDDRKIGKKKPPKEILLICCRSCKRSFKWFLSFFTTFDCVFILFLVAIEFSSYSLSFNPFGLCFFCPESNEDELSLENYNSEGVSLDRIG